MYTILNLLQRFFTGKNVLLLNDPIDIVFPFIYYLYLLEIESAKHNI